MNAPIVATLAGFGAGVALLQASARLPPRPGTLALVCCAAVGAMLLATARARSGEACAPLRDSGNGSARLAFDRLAGIAATAATAGLLGFFYAAWRGETRLADALPGAWETRDVRVTGVVDDLPQTTSAGSHFAFAVERALTVGAVVPHRLSLGWYASPTDDSGDTAQAPVVHAGERWDLTLRLKRPHGNVNPDGFDLEAWLLEHDLRATGYVRDDSANRRTSEFAGRPGDYVQRARERIRARIAAALPQAPYAGVLTALAIGDQRAIPQTQWSVFGRTGITHLVSISGLHVTVFAALAGACVLAAARRSPALTSRVPARKVAAASGAVVAFGYVLLAGAEVPAVRTLLMLVVAAAGVWLARPGTAMLVLLWALAAVLAWDPWATLAPGFWLSFGAVALLLYAGSGRLHPPRGSGWRARLAESVRESCHAQWVVTVGLVPGTLALFQQVSVLSALANAVAIPVVTLCVVPLALSGIVIPVDAPWWAAHAVLSLLMRYLEWLAALPVAAWTSHAPRGWTVPVAIAGLLWLLAPRGVPGRALGLAWTLPMALLLPPGVPPGGVRVVVLDVGQGLAVVVATAAHALLYDTGPRLNGTADAGARIVVPYLRAAGVGRLDALVVSHADSDHSGGALSILHAVPVSRLVSSLPSDHPIVADVIGTKRAAAGAAERWPSREDAPGAVRSTRCAAGERWDWDGVAFEFLHPPAAAYQDAARKSNDYSCVLHIRSPGGGVLLTGDVEAASEAQMLARDAASLRSDVLLVPHHGSRTSSTLPFIAAVAPRFAVIAAGYHNRFGHPRGDVLARYARAGALRPRTDVDGAITVEVSPEHGIEAIGERARRPRYWYASPAR